MHLLRSSGRTALATAVALIVVMAVSLSQAGARDPRAHAATTCDLSKDGRKLGPTYTTSLRASGVTCRKAKQLVTRYDACRKKHGHANGTCKTAAGFACTEKRVSIPTEFSAKVICKRTGTTVKFAYTQFT